MFKSLRSKLFMTYILACMIIVTLFGGIIFVQQRETLTEIIQDNSLAQSKIHAENVSNTLETHLNLLYAIAESDGAKALDHNAVFSRFQELIDNEHLFVFAGGIMYPDGRIYDINGTSNTVMERQYFKDIFKNNVDYVVSDPFIGKFRNFQVVVMAVPIISSGERIAALVLPINLEDISMSLQSIDVTERSYGWIIHQSGLVLAHPNTDLILKMNILKSDEYGFTGLTEIGRSMYNHENGTGLYYDTNIEEYKMLSFVEIEKTPGWRLGITTPLAEIHAPLDRLYLTTIGIISFAILLSIILALAFSSTITKPLYALTAAVTNMRKGQLDTIPKNEGASEITTLVTAFNDMAYELTDLSDNLEIKVGQRTQSLREINRHLNDLATKDHLTKLYNRPYVIEALGKLKAFSDENGDQYFGILFIDLNNFKYYNDTFGHDKGDELLKLVSGLIHSHFRVHDIVSRYGGDEFIIILTDLNHENFEQIVTSFKHYAAEEIDFKEELSSIVPMENVPHDKLLSFAIGYCYYSPKEARTIDRLIQVADERMYEHKALIKKTLV